MSCAPQAGKPLVKRRAPSPTQHAFCAAMLDRKLVWRASTNLCTLLGGDAIETIVPRGVVIGMLRAGLIEGPLDPSKKDASKFDAHYKLTAAGREAAKKQPAKKACKKSAKCCKATCKK